MKRILFSLCLALVLGITSAGIAAQVSPNDIAIVSASSGGTAYYIVAGQTTILNSNMRGYTFTNESSTGAPSVNGSYCNSDPSLMAYIPFDGLYAGIKGDQSRGFKKALDRVGFIYGGHQLYLYFVTLDNSGINSISDFKGKKISLPPTGTTGYYQALAVLEAYGLDPKKDVSAVPMNYADASDAMKDGALNAIIVNGGLNQPTVAELDTTKKIKILTIEEGPAKKLSTAHPYWDIDPLPSGCYAQQPKNLLVINASTCMIANLQLSDDLVYKITKILLNNVDALTKIHRDGAYWNLEKSIALIKKNLVTVHPGAMRYYKEIGAIK